MKRFIFILALAFASVPCFAQIRPTFGVSVGYSNIELQHPASYLHYDRDGSYIDGELGATFGGRPVGLFVGVGASGAFHSNTEDFHYTDNFGNHFVVFDTTSWVGFYTLEGRIGVPISLTGSRRERRGFFLFPKIGAGLLVSNYAIDTRFGTEYHTGPAFEIRPAIQAGFTWGPGAAGIEASYMWAWGDFGNLGDRAQEARIGGFFRVRF